MSYIINYYYISSKTCHYEFVTLRHGIVVILLQHTCCVQLTLYAKYSVCKTVHPFCNTLLCNWRFLNIMYVVSRKIFFSEFLKTKSRSKHRISQNMFLELAKAVLTCTHRHEYVPSKERYEALCSGQNIVINMRHYNC